MAEGAGMTVADVLPIGTRVTYDDEPRDNPACIGTVRKPTADELAHAKLTYEDEGIGPAYGDVIVQWDGDEAWDRSWEKPRDLRVVGQVSAVVDG